MDSLATFNSIGSLGYGVYKSVQCAQSLQSTKIAGLNSLSHCLTDAHYHGSSLPLTNTILLPS